MLSFFSSDRNVMKLMCSFLHVDKILQRLCHTFKELYLDYNISENLLDINLVLIVLRVQLIIDCIMR